MAIRLPIEIPIKAIKPTRPRITNAIGIRSANQSGAPLRCSQAATGATLIPTIVANRIGLKMEELSQTTRTSYCDHALELPDCEAKVGCHIHRVR